MYASGLTIAARTDMKGGPDVESGGEERDERDDGDGEREKMETDAAGG